MTKKKEEQKEQKEQIEQPVLSEEEQMQLVTEAYDELARQDPPREVEMPEEKQQASSDGPATLGDAVNAAEDLTDLQFAMTKLFPEKLDNRSVMIARVDPNVYISMLHLMSVDEIMRSDPMKPIDVNGIYMNNNTALSIGLDGMGRIDTAELSGAAREEKKATAMLGAGRIL